MERPSKVHYKDSFYHTTLKGNQKSGILKKNSSKRAIPNIKTKELTFISIFIIFFSLVLFSGCGESGPKQDESTGDNFYVRETVVEVLNESSRIEEEIRSKILLAKQGSMSLNDALDCFVDPNKELVSLIEDASAPPDPPDKKLKEARELVCEYLRNRVHQLEGCMNAKSADELESLYNEPVAELTGEFGEIRSILIEYDPEIEKMLQ
ncbi:MAG: hypothetical protein PHP64_08240 [Actinomycetota bacterium]|nr:hypothetical protein [Actinomycetota bacterium]